MRVRQRFDALGLAAQVAAAGGVLGLAAAAAAWRWAGGEGSAALAAAGALAATVAATLLVRRNAAALGAVESAARTLARDETADEGEIALETSNAELRAATAQLRRMVESARRRRQALEARNRALGQQLSARTHELSTLQDLSIGLAAKSDLGELVDEALGALEQTLEYSSASLWGRNEPDQPVALLGYRTGEGIAGPDTAELVGMRLSRANLQRYEQVEHSRQPLIENDARQSLLSWLWTKVTDDARSSALYRVSRSWMAVPLATRDRVMGVMRVDHERPDYFDAERARLLQAVSSQTALALRHAELLEREREVAVVAERNRIARELHDAVSQTLFAANVLAGTLARAAGRERPPEPAALRRQAESLERLNRAALAEMRLLMFELRPDALHRLPLAELLQHAIEALGSRGGIEVEASLARQDSLPAELRIQIYRIAQEALSNAGRHSGAGRVEVQWEAPGPHEARLRIADNGRGFDPERPVPGHFGLENMRARAREIGARFTLTSSPGAGTELLLEIGPGTDGG